jgi:hypothetical protein
LSVLILPSGRGCHPKELSSGTSQPDGGWLGTLIIS